MDRDDKILKYVQDRLNAQERAAFEVEIAGDADLSAQIAALTGARTAMVPGDTPDVATGWSRLSAQIDAERSSPANDNRPILLSLLQVACIAVASVLLWQIVVSPLLNDRQGIYAPASVEAEGPQLQVIFAETATFGDVSSLLNALDGTIVSGPGALGLYRISFVDEAARTAAQEALAGRSDLVANVLAD